MKRGKTWGLVEKSNKKSHKVKINPPVSTAQGGILSRHFSPKLWAELTVFVPWVAREKRGGGGVGKYSILTRVPCLSGRGGGGQLGTKKSSVRRGKMVQVD